MKALFNQPKTQEAIRQKQAVSQERSPGISPLSSTAPLFQRQCACGGGCPRCQEDLGLQTKLKISEPGDQYEQEADRIADEVMRMPEPKVQRVCPECKEELQRQPMAAAKEEETLQTKLLAESITPLIQRPREPTEEEKKKDEEILQTKPLAEPINPLIQQQTKLTREEKEKKEEPLQTETASGEASTVSPALQYQIVALQGGGQPLPEAERHFFEPRFGRTFENVRIHTDSAAAESARDIRALAYTTGSDIVFGEGKYRPETHEGKRLIAHELTHVVQQSSNRVARSVQRVCGPTDISAAVAGRANCNDRFGSPFLPGLPLFKFDTSCDDFATGQDTALQTFVAGQPATATFEIHGFASSDGARDFNRDLGCARAMKAFSVMTTADPAHGFAGIAAPRITAVVNHGPVTSSSAPASSLRSVVIRVLGGSPGPTPTPPPAGLQTITIPTAIRGTATPATMTQNRIPPRVDTPVTVTFAGTPSISTPVTLAVEGGGGGNGSATVDGAASSAFAVTGTTVVNLRGVDQTLDAAHAGHLRLVARQRGTQIGASGGFSVSSIPVNMFHPFNRLITDADCPTFGFAAGCGFRGMIVDQNMDSDSGVRADLDRANQSERIQLVTATGRFAGASPTTGCYVPCSPSPPDFHGIPGLAGASSPGVITFNQTFMFRDNRTGASEIPMADSGFIINFDVAPIPGSGILGFFQSFQLTVSSIGTALSSTDPNPTCPSGTITSTAGRTSVTRIIPL